MKKLLGIAVLTGAILALPYFTQAADAPADAPKTEKKPRGMPINGKVGAVDKTAKTITLEGKEKARVFQITSETRIRKDRKPATLDDVVIGDRVGGFARENADGKMEVVTLNAGLAQPRAKENQGEKKPAN